MAPTQDWSHGPGGVSGGLSSLQSSKERGPRRTGQPWVGGTHPNGTVLLCACSKGASAS